MAIGMAFLGKKTKSRKPSQKIPLFRRMFPSIGEKIFGALGPSPHQIFVTAQKIVQKTRRTQMKPEKYTLKDIGSFQTRLVHEYAVFVSAKMGMGTQGVKKENRVKMMDEIRTMFENILDNRLNSLPLAADPILNDGIKKGNPLWKKCCQNYVQIAKRLNDAIEQISSNEHHHFTTQAVHGLRKLKKRRGF